MISGALSIASKLPEVGTTIFTVMSALAAEHKAINLGQGFPDYPMNEELVELVNKAMKEGYNQYVHMNGFPPLRTSIAEKIFSLYQTEIDPDKEITVTPGGTYALFTALATILQPGDEVIVFEPAYDSYIPAIELNGARAVAIELKFPDYSINWEEVRSLINKNTRAIMINSPHNPTGAVLSATDMEELEKITTGTNIMIISDEVYEHLIFDDKKHESVIKYPGLFNRSIACFSFGKVYNCTGWKLGYVVAPEWIMKEFRKIHQFNCFTCDTPKQVALSTFIRQPQHYLELGKELEAKRNYFMELMKPSRFTPLPSHGSYFQIYSYSVISDLPEKDFAIELTRKAGVATIPVSSFYRKAVNNQVLRFCFSKKNETLEQAAERLVSL